jgi:hypothetical protein
MWMPMTFVFSFQNIVKLLMSKVAAQNVKKDMSQIIMEDVFWLLRRFKIVLNTNTLILKEKSLQNGSMDASCHAKLVKKTTNST